MFAALVLEMIMPVGPAMPPSTMGPVTIGISRDHA